MKSSHFTAGILAALSLCLTPPAFSDEPLTGLSVAEAEDLTYMREEEKLARDVYLTMDEYWHNRIFVNIAESEQTHTETIQMLLDKYGLVDPALDAIGYFTNSDLQALYDELVTRGMASELEALHVGGLIEEVDMRDIQEAIERTDHEDIANAYESLLCGSRNHLRAFVDAIERQGVSYEAQHLSQDEVDTIVESPMERCGDTDRIHAD